MAGVVMKTLLGAPGPGGRPGASGNCRPGRTRGGSGAPAGRRRRAWIPGTASLLCLLIGCSDVLAIFRPWQEDLYRISVFVPGTLADVTRSADVLAGLLLVLLSRGLRRRKRRAWQAVVALLAFDLAIHVLHAARGHPRAYSAVVAAVLIAGLLYFRHDFYAVADPRTRWTALRVFAGLTAADLAIGLGFLAAGGLARNYPVPQRITDVIDETIGLTGPVSFVSDGRSDLYHLLTSALGLLTLVVTVYLLLRPARPQARLGEADAAGIRELLARHGDRDSLGYFALRDDKSVIWSGTGKACVCYRVVSGVMLAAGDPIGDPEAWPGAIREFLAAADRHAWRPAVLGCSELGAEIWCREGGLTALELGDEAIVDAGEFTLSGRAMRNVRQMASRAGRHGYAAEVRRVRDIPRRELDQIRTAAASWRGGPVERGFSMALGRIGGAGDGDCVVATARKDGTLRGVLHFVPWGSGGLSLDLMRRDRSAQPGLNEFLIVAAIKAAPALGVNRISLNFAVFRAVLERGGRIGAGPVLRAWRSLLLFASRWYQIESLYKFNAKFSPAWQPRFFVFPGGRDAARVALAALQAEAFLAWPKLEAGRYARGIARRLRAAGAPSRPGHCTTPRPRLAANAVTTAAGHTRGLMTTTTSMPARPGPGQATPRPATGHRPEPSQRPDIRQAPEGCQSRPGQGRQGGREVSIGVGPPGRGQGRQYRSQAHAVQAGQAACTGQAPRAGQDAQTDVSQRVSDADVRMATFAYLAAIFLGPVIPLALYAPGRRRSPFLRYHTVTALNLSLTGLLYALCCLIAGGLLILDSLTAALVITLPIALALWLAMLRYLIRGARAAKRGEQDTVPGWICARIAR